MAGFLTFIFVLLYIPVMLIIILISRGSQAERNRAARAAFHGKAKEYLESAKKMYDISEYKLALASVRNSLEALVKYLCDKYEICYNDQANINLFELIDALFGERAITEQQKNLMHQIRIESNKGSHVELNEVPVTASEASKAIGKMDDLIGSLYHTHKEIVPGMFD